MSENHKKIWITGASSGIGKAVAEKFAKEGWQVAISARTRDKLDKIAQHPNIFSFPLDVTIKKDCERVFQDIINKFKTIDLCILCSGTYDPNKNTIKNSKA